MAEASVPSSKPTLGYWKIRGLGAPVRYLLAYLDVDYDLVEYEQGDGPDFSRQVMCVCLAV